MDKAETISKVRAILAGIDKCEVDDDEGWWETSTGAGFGAHKLAEVEALLGAITDDQ